MGGMNHQNMGGLMQCNPFDQYHYEKLNIF